ncbi:MAG: hypothetical protein KF713_08090 [Turneriella sp.]|nr:hypothetical protein [Turneriella sp.]
MYARKLFLTLAIFLGCRSDSGRPLSDSRTSSPRSTAPTLVLKAVTNKAIHVAPYFGSYAGDNPAFQLSEIMDKQPFVYEKQNSIHHGFTGKTLWFHLRYRYVAESNEPLLLMLGNYVMHYVDFYFIRDGKLVQQRSTGQARPFSQRYAGLREISTPLPVATEPIDLYLRVQSPTTIYFNPTVKAQQLAIERDHLDQIIAGLIFGAQAVLILFNLFLFFSLRDRSYLLYSVYIFSWLVFELNNGGFSARYFFPEHPEWDSRILPLNSLLIHGSFMLFTEYFIQIGQGITRNILKYGGWSLLALALPVAFMPQPLTNRILLTLTFPVVIVILIHAGQSMRLRRPSAGYFLVATLISFLIIPLFILTRLIKADADNAAMNALMMYSLPVTIVTEAVVFSFALADRYRRLREENELQRVNFAAELKNERRQIFSELHDIVGSDLALLMLKTADARSSSMRQLRDRVSGIAKSLRDLLDLDELDSDLPQKLTAIIEERAREVAALAKMDLKTEFKPVNLSPRAAFHIQRFAFEGLANALRHSRASRLKLRLTRRGNFVRFILADNGVGFRKEKRASGHGLRNLASRGRSLKGRVRIFTAPGKGVIVIVSFHSGMQ